MEARVDSNNAWYLLMRLRDVNPDGEEVVIVNIISFKTEAEAKRFVEAFDKSTKKTQGFMAWYKIINKNDFERIK